MEELRPLSWNQKKKLYYFPSKNFFCFKTIKNSLKNIYIYLSMWGLNQRFLFAPCDHANYSNAGFGNWNAVCGKYSSTLLNRPSVARAVLQTPLWLIDSLSKSFFLIISSKPLPFQTSLHIAHGTSYMSQVTCHMSCLTCLM